MKAQDKENKAISERSATLFLHKRIEDDTFFVHGAPHVDVLATNSEHYLIKVPHRVTSSMTPTKIAGNGWVELHGPAPDGIVADLDPAFREQIFDVVQA